MNQYKKRKNVGIFMRFKNRVRSNFIKFIGISLPRLLLKAFFFNDSLFKK